MCWSFCSDRFTVCLSVILIIIDHVALAKQGDNTLGSVRPSFSLIMWIQADSGPLIQVAFFFPSPRVLWYNALHRIRKEPFWGFKKPQNEKANLKVGSSAYFIALFLFCVLLGEQKEDGWHHISVDRLFRNPLDYIRQ